MGDDLFPIPNSLKDNFNDDEAARERRQLHWDGFNYSEEVHQSRIKGECSNMIGYKMASLPTGI